VSFLTGLSVLDRRHGMVLSAVRVYDAGRTKELLACEIYSGLWGTSKHRTPPRPIHGLFRNSCRHGGRNTSPDSADRIFQSETGEVERIASRPPGVTLHVSLGCASFAMSRSHIHEDNNRVVT